MRGEHMRQGLVRPALRGSPPHARGTRERVAALDPAVGITPACAGNTVTAAPDGTEVQDHPRMRGEHARLHSL